MAASTGYKTLNCKETIERGLRRLSRASVGLPEAEQSRGFSRALVGSVEIHLQTKLETLRELVKTTRASG